MTFSLILKNPIKLFIFSFFLISLFTGNYFEYYPFPTWDLWDAYLGWNLELNRSEDIYSAIKKFLNLHNEHLIIYNRIIFYLDYKFNFGFKLAQATNVFIILSSFIIIIILCYKAIKILSLKTNLWIFASISILFFNWFQKTNLISPMQIQFNLYYLFLLAICTFIYLDNETKNNKYFYTLLILFFFAFYTGGHGVFYYVPLFINYLLKKNIKKLVIITLIFMINLFIYSYLSSTSNNNLFQNVSMVFSSLQAIIDFFCYCFIQLGSFFFERNPNNNDLFMNITFGFIIYLLCFFVLIDLIFKLISDPKNNLNLLFFLLLITLFTITHFIVLARFNYGQLIFAQSRYSTNSSLIVIVIIFYFFINNYFNFYNLQKILTLVLFFNFYSNQAMAFKSIKWAPKSEIAALDLYLGIYDNNSLTYIYHSGENDFKHLSKYFYNDSMVNYPHYKNYILKIDNISKNLINIDLKFENNCKGLIIDLHEFKNTNFLKVNGWVFDVKKKNVPDFSYIIQEDIIIGFAITGNIKFHEELINDISTDLTKKSGFIGYINNEIYKKDLDYNFYC